MFKVKTIGGKRLTLAELQGKVVVINFWFIGCAPCISEMPALNKLVDSKLGYYIRPGKHSMSAGDWMVFLDFADRQFGIKR